MFLKENVPDHMFFSGIKWKFNLVVGHVQGAHIYELLEKKLSNFFRKYSF